MSLSNCPCPQCCPDHWRDDREPPHIEYCDVHGSYIDRCGACVHDEMRDRLQTANRDAARLREALLYIARRTTDAAARVHAEKAAKT